MFDKRVRTTSTQHPRHRSFLYNGTKAQKPPAVYYLVRTAPPSASPSASTCQIPLAWGQLKSSLLPHTKYLAAARTHKKIVQLFTKNDVVRVLHQPPSHEKKKHLLCKYDADFVPRMNVDGRSWSPQLVVVATTTTSVQKKKRS